MRKRLSIIAVLVLGAILVAACTANGVAQSSTTPAQPEPAAPTAEQNEAPVTNPDTGAPAGGLPGSSWILTELDGAAPVDSQNPPTLEFEADRLAGMASCNRYFAGFTADGTTLTVTQPGSTMMACSEEVMQQEMVFLDLLQRAAGYTIADDTLTITADDGATLVFTRA